MHDVDITAGSRQEINQLPDRKARQPVITQRRELRLCGAYQFCGSNLTEPTRLCGVIDGYREVHFGRLINRIRNPEVLENIPATRCHHHR